MRKFLFIYSLLATAAVWFGASRCTTLRNDVERLSGNQKVLCDSIIHYRTRLGREAASVEALQLRCSEYERLRTDDARTIRELGIRLKRLESTASTALLTQVEFRTPAPAEDLSKMPPDSAGTDTLGGRRFFWSDGWVTVEGSVGRDSVECRVESIDTLRQAVHRVPRKFLFIRYGTKAVRQEVVSSNPHTRIVCTEYIELTDGRRSRRGRRVQKG